MATKKQKRLLGEARQQSNREAVIASGLKAQARDREMRAKKAREAKAESQMTEARLAALKVASGTGITKRDFERTGVDLTTVPDCESVEF